MVCACVAAAGLALSSKAVSTVPGCELVKYWKRPCKRYCPCWSKLASGIASKTEGCWGTGMGTAVAEAMAGTAINSESLILRFLLPMQVGNLGGGQPSPRTFGQVSKRQGAETDPPQVYHTAAHRFQHAPDL